MILLLVFCEAGFAQIKKIETVEWINTQGEENLKDITGNTSIHWELDEYGTLKITNYKPDGVRAGNVVKSYIYLNLYELDPETTSLKKPPRNSKITRLVLKCRTEKNNCIKTRKHFKGSGSRTDASSSYLFNLRDRFDTEKGKRLERDLILAIRLFGGKSSGLE